MQSHFYDAQIRRFLLQLVRVFSNFQLQYADGTLVQVPVIYGDSSRQVASIIRRNSENTVVAAPLISLYITALKYDRERIQNPTYVDTAAVRQRRYDAVTDSYLAQQGNAYTVERHMPVPYELDVRTDIWTSNTDQKLQLLEQLLVLFNPALEIQSTDQYLDWTSLSVLELTGVTWSNRSIPQGTDDNIDVASLDFRLPIWLSMPARVRRLGVVERIISSVFSGADAGKFPDQSGDLLGSPQIITFQNLGIWVHQAQIQLLTTDATAELSWPAVLDKYGVIRNGLSQVRLSQADAQGQWPTEPTGAEIVGTISVHPSDDRILLFNVDTDTVPVNTLDPVNAIINPQQVAPGMAGLPAAAAGQRYLLLASTGSTQDNQAAPAWFFGGTETVAQTNDIIEFIDGSWQLVFQSSSNTQTQYVTNLTTGIQYRWQQGQWLRSWEGEYPAAGWRLVL